jgi:hypothetical protein
MTRSRRFRWVAGVVSLAALVAALHWPVTTFRAVDDRLETRQIRLYEKAVDFVSRDLQARRLVREITGGLHTPEARILAILDWVVEHVQPIPPGFAVVDDHVFHVVHRGYGAPYQRIEVFTLLASHAGMPSGLAPIGMEPAVALVRIGAAAHVFDVVNGVAFFRSDGELATVEDLIAEPALVIAACPGGECGSRYERLVGSLNDLRPNLVHMESQRPLTRLRMEVRNFIVAVRR